MARTGRTVIEGLGFSEGPRWHDGRLWFSDVGAAAVFALDPVDGEAEEVHQVPTRPSGLGWLPDGRLLVVSMTDRRLLRSDPDGTTLIEHADLSDLASSDCNDMVVDGRGNAYVGNTGFSLTAQPIEPRPAEVVLVRPDGSAEVVDDQVMFPNGSVVTPDGDTLVVAETFGGCLTAFTIGANGGLSDRRTWAEIPGAAPDGICLDAEGAIWVADATSASCLRVAEGGAVLDQVDVGPQQAFACALGGTDRATLFVCAADGFDGNAIQRRTGRIVAFDVDVPGAGWP